ncbi:hypothetical protein P154DRAFT_524294 [Amniculicola lignicola CBS 123094]|uniref:Uncharacterized protein n=1 Tax=Amniculicola lignicola CBS 123094 TaxID=1392246 RepID=A0A6A5WGA0_9PLEO|nr:hypothetical protein P154DRAFT_524294 [Amniculicola lignicola CBS 123094]
MPDLAADSKTPQGPFETPDRAGGTSAQISASPTLHGPAIADAALAATLPPTLTPATTTRQSVALGVLSTLWGNTSAPTTRPPNSAAERAVPSIVAHAPSPDAQEPPADLTTSTSSVPSTTTTLTNTLPPTQSAALRALNAPAFQSHASPNARSKAAKSTSSRTTLSSQPVVVRTYSGSRHTSRPASGLSTPRPFHTMSGQPPRNPSALSAGLAGHPESLPSVDDFSFSAILRAVDPEIRDAIDAIAEICARSRLSLADEYDAHLPPQGEITGGESGWGAGMAPLIARGRISRIGQGWSAGENTLTAVPEASSSSERLASESRGAPRKGKRNQSAYGSLKSVISGGSGKRKAIDANTFKAPEPTQQNNQGPSWTVTTSSAAVTHPSITLLTSPQASKQLSLDTSSTIKEIHRSAADIPTQRPQTAVPKQSTHRRQISNTSIPPLRTRSNTLSSFTSWMPWSRAPDAGPSTTPQELTKVEARLREMLMQSQHSTAGKGKGPLAVA